ncbi:MAG: chemotaxis protein CheW [Pseudomonadota bacterium]
MARSQATESGQYLTFALSGEEFALEIAKVREVLDYPHITKVPRMPEYLRGVINLRGNVVPVIDLHLKFGMAATERTVDTCVVIVEAALENEVTVMGVLADSVQEVVDLSTTEIEPPPRMGTRLNTDFLKGMGKQGEKFIIILDIDKVLSSSEISLVTGAGEVAAKTGTAAAAEAVAQ